MNKIVLLFENAEFFEFTIWSEEDYQSYPVIIDKNKIFLIEEEDTVVVGYFFYKKIRRVYSGSAIEKEITSWLKENRPEMFKK